MRLALFDLDHTLLSGDSDLLWCEFLIDQGLLDAGFRERNEEMGRRYREGTVGSEAFCSFFAATLAGRTPEFWQPWRERFLHEVVRPRIPDAARALLQQHRDQGDLLVLTTATNRALTELTAQDLGIEHLLATELAMDQGRYSGRTLGEPNMREGKWHRLREWLARQHWPGWLIDTASFYSDSINDLPLLARVGRPVAVDPDPRLEATARRHGWPVLRLDRRAPAAGPGRAGPPAAAAAEGGP